MSLVPVRADASVGISLGFGQGSPCLGVTRIKCHMIRTVPHSEHINSVVFVFDVRDGIEYQFEEAQSYLGQHKKPRVKTCPGLAQLSLVYTLLLSLPSC